MQENRPDKQDYEKPDLKKENEEFINTSRRKALKTIAAGTAVAGGMALAGKWSKPVVDTIILPAHAQATNATEPTDATTTAAPTTTAGTCSPVLERAGVSVVARSGGFITRVMIGGAIQPPEDGVQIDIIIRATNSSGHTSTITPLNNPTTTQGNFLMFQNFAPQAEINMVGITATGPCGDSIDASTEST